MFDMLKALQLRLDGAEAQRKKDLEQAEAQRKEGLEQAEAQRKRDMKQAAEKAEAQRKSDQANAREQSRKLLVNINELEYKIKRLEQQAADRDLERKQKDEATQRYIESLAGDIEATTDFLAVGVSLSTLLFRLPFSNVLVIQDKVGLDRIKRRNLLDRAQALLASHLGLANNNSYSASLSFREALGPLSSSDERQTRLSDILREKRDQLPHETVSLITKPAALVLLAERFSKVRLHGDQVAHGYCPQSWYEGAVTRSVDKAALLDLLDLVTLVGK